MCLICQGSDAAGGQLLTRIGFIQPLVSYQTSAHDKAAQRRMSPVQFCNHSVHLSCFEVVHVQLASFTLRITLVVIEWLFYVSETIRQWQQQLTRRFH